MPTMTAYTPGVPCWIDLSTADREAAMKFYTAVLGWKDYDVSPEEAGFYTMPRMKDQSVAGMMTQSDDETNMGVPPHWNTYVRVDSADDATKKAKDLGATIVVEPMDVMDVGRMAVFLDPEGAGICVWQPNQFPGAGVVNEPGAFIWSEMYTKDPEAAKAFYTGLFGWNMEVNDGLGGYIELKVGDHTFGGMMEITAEMGPIPPNWLVYFAVDDADAAVEAAKAAGGSAMMGPMDIPQVGRFAVLADGQGAVFAVIKTAGEPAS
ncbi:MAG: VOC family protein [Acidimicrobiia bacterium]|nr:VOC family protein [Acidimicrobiia bacterium]